MILSDIMSIIAPDCLINVVGYFCGFRREFDLPVLSDRKVLCVSDVDGVLEIHISGVLRYG